MAQADTIVVRSSEELDAALALAKGGETIRLEPGRYSDVAIRNRNFGTAVTLEGGPDVILEQARVAESSNLFFTGMTFEAVRGADDSSATAGLYISGGSGITVEGATFRGAVDDDWSNDGIGLRADETSGITVRDSTFHHLVRGAVFRYADGVTASGNTVTAMRSDGFDFAAVRDVLVENNHMADFPVQNGDPTAGGDHKDFIQFWTHGVDYASSDVVIRGNTLIENGSTTQGIFVSSENNLVYENFVIEDNIVYSSSYHAVTLAPAVNATVRNNTVVTMDGGFGGINVADGSRVTVTDNVASAIRVGGGASASQSGNVIVQHDRPTGENYIGDVLVNPFKPAGADDLAVVDGGGAGARRTVETPYRVAAQTDALNGLLTRFSAADFGARVPDGADCRWTFGDGRTAVGREVEHHFARGGAYDVTLTVTSGGESVTVGRQQTVHSPILLDLSFDAEGDSSDVPQDVSWVGTASTTEGVDGAAAHLVAAEQRSLRVARADALSGLSSMTVSMQFQNTDPTQSSRLFVLPGAYSVALSGESLSIAITTQDGITHKMSADVAGLGDGGWHGLSLSYDGVAGTAGVWLDGEQVMSRDGVFGAIAATTGRDLMVGSSFGGSYVSGNLDNFRIYEGWFDPSGEQVLKNGIVQASLTPEAAPEPEAELVEGSTSPQTFTVAPDIYQDFDAAGADAVSGLDVKTVGDVRLAQGEEADAASFDGASYIKLGRDQRFFEKDTLSVSFDFKAEAGAGEQQTMLWNHMRYGVTTRGSELRVVLMEVDGTRTDIAVADGVKHGTWQNVIFDYSRDTGVANVYLDGEKAATREGLNVDIGGPSYWDVTVGSDGFSKHFTGEIRDLEVLQSAPANDTGGPMVGSRSSTLQSLALADYVGVTDASTSLLAEDDTAGGDTTLFATSSSLTAA